MLNSMKNKTEEKKKILHKKCMEEKNTFLNGKRKKQNSRFMLKIKKHVRGKKKPQDIFKG